MLKSILLTVTSAVLSFGYPLPLFQPVPPGCVATHIADLPGVSCSVFDPYLGRVVPGPFVPFQPYVDWASNAQSVHHSFVTSQVEQFQNWQLNDFDHYRAYWEASPWPKPYGFDAVMDNQREWIEYHQKLHNVNLDIANKGRQQFLNGNRPSSESSSP